MDKQAIEIDGRRVNIPLGFVLPALRLFLARHRRSALRWLSLLLLAAAAIFAVHGNSIVLSELHHERPQGLPWLGLGVVAWLAGELLRDLPQIFAWWRGLDRAGKGLALARIAPAGMALRAVLLVIESMWADSSLPLLLSALAWLGAGAILWLALSLYSRQIRPKSDHLEAAAAGALIGARERLPGLSLPRGWRRFMLLRTCLLAVAVGLSATVWQQTSENQFHGNALWLWLLSSLMWCLALAPRGWSPQEWLTRQTDRWRRIRWQSHLGVLFCVAGIVGLAALFRFARLDSLPREMLNMDHVHEVEIAWAITEGQRPIMAGTFQFQEPGLMYLVALLGQMPGLGLGHLTLQVATSLASMATALAMIWTGMEWGSLVGRGNRKALGLLCAGLVAVSFWHVATTRYAQRTTFTPLFAALTMIFLARAMRCNRRGDFLLLGLTLGFGMYGYSAYRVWAAVAVAGLGLTIALRRLTWRQRLAYAVNAAFAGIVAFAIYLPQYRYFLDHPALAQSQFSVNMFGVYPGEPINVDLDVFLTGLMVNFRDALLMFHWSGDHRSWQNVPWKPALSAVAGALFVLGLAALAVRLIKRPRRAGYWLLPLIILIAMLPSVLLVAQPQTNPSNTRISGAIPAVYLLVALPPVIIASRLAEGLRRPWGKMPGAALCVCVALACAMPNADAYFKDFAWVERQPGNSYRHLGRTMRGYAQSGGSWGNIFFVITRPFIPAMQNAFVEAGQPVFRSGSGLEGTINLLDSASHRDDEYRIDPDTDIIFLYEASAEEVSEQLRQWFPQGNGVVMSDRAYFGRDYVVYRVPAMGEEGLREFLARHL